MKKQVQQLYEKYLEMTEGDKAAAASLALADVMFEEPESAIPESLTVAEAAKRLHVSPNTVYDLVPEARSSIIASAVPSACARPTSRSIDDVPPWNPGPRLADTALIFDPIGGTDPAPDTDE